jgi:hypothetical protein
MAQLMAASTAREAKNLFIFIVFFPFLIWIKQKHKLRLFTGAFKTVL